MCRVWRWHYHNAQEVLEAIGVTICANSVHFKSPHHKRVLPFNDTIWDCTAATSLRNLEDDDHTQEDDDMFVNKTRYAATMISKQERCIKRCDQFVTASSKRCDACIYSSILCNETRVSDHESHGFGNGWLNGTARLLVIPVQKTYTTFRRLPVSSNFTPTLNCRLCTVQYAIRTSYFHHTRRFFSPRFFWDIFDHEGGGLYLLKSFPVSVLNI